LFYRLAACPINKELKEQSKSLDYAIGLHSCFRKLFSTKEQFVVDNCMTYFECLSVSKAVKEKKAQVP